MSNPWHSISRGEDTPKFVNAIIEIPNGSRTKYELDKDTGMLKLDRVLYSSMQYPANYGFIPQTYCDDKDPLDILILASVDIQPMCLVEAKVIGVMTMIDGGEQDDKLIAVLKDDMEYKHIEDIDQVSPHKLKEIVNFFETYKMLENKEVSVEGLQNAEKAFEIVKESIELYDKTF